MARIAGVDLKPNLKISYALADIYGIGLTRSKLILKANNVDEDLRTKDVVDSDIVKIKDYIEANCKIEGELRQEEFRNIKRLKDIRSYRGDRHKKSLPCRGQRTRKKLFF